MSKKILPILLFLAIVVIATGYYLARPQKTTYSPSPKKESTPDKEQTKGFSLDEKVTLPFSMSLPPAISFPDQVCNIADYDAVSGGKTENTAAFQKAIAACADAGGGKVEVPSGIWLTGPIRLESNIDLDVDKGAEIVFSSDFKDYLPPVFTRFQGIELYNYSSPIYAQNVQNVAITGQGKLNGQGKAWYDFNQTEEAATQALQANPNDPAARVSFGKLYLMGRENVPVTKRIFGDEKDALAPPFIQFVNSKNILLQGVSIENSPSWTIQPIYCQNITIRDISIKNDGPNTDGVDIDSSQNVLIEKSKFDTGDDAVAIKSGRDEDGLRVARPSENIIFRNSQIDSAHSALAIGSEISGGVKNVLAYNLDVNYVTYGVRLKSTQGRGGNVEGVWVKNMNVHRATSTAIQIDSDYGTPVPGYDQTTLTSFKNINIGNLYCRRTSRAAELIGLPTSPLEDLNFKNLDISAKRGIEEKNVGMKNFESVSIRTD